MVSEFRLECVDTTVSHVTLNACLIITNKIVRTIFHQLTFQLLRHDNRS